MLSFNQGAHRLCLSKVCICRALGRAQALPLSGVHVPCVSQGVHKLCLSHGVHRLCFGRGGVHLLRSLSGYPHQAWRGTLKFQAALKRAGPSEGKMGRGVACVRDPTRGTYEYTREVKRTYPTRVY